MKYMGSKNRIAKHLIPIMYEMPEQLEYNGKTYKFECVWQGEIKTNFASGRKQATHNAVEKLFKVVGV